MTNEAAVAEFRADLARGMREIRARLDGILQAAGFIMWEGVTVGGDLSLGTPVDTGHASNSWWIRLGAPGGTHPNPPTYGERSSPRIAFEAAAVEILGARIGDEVAFCNGAPYINRLEYQGHSRQAPDGWVRIAASQWIEVVERVARAMPANAPTGGRAGGLFGG